MRKFILIFVVCMVVFPVILLAKVWELRDSRLSVAFDDRTALFSVKDLRNGKQWIQKTEAGKVKVKSVKQENGSLHLYLEAAFPFEAFVSLSADSGVQFELKAKGKTPMTEFDYPPAFTTENKDYYLLYTDGEGLLLPVDDTRYPLGNGITYFCGGGLSMAWMGIVDKQFRSGYMAILETPYDAALRTIRQEDGLVTFKPVWLSSMETFSYNRRITYHFFDQGGYVAQCKKYRDYIWKKNGVVTLKEKQRRFPAIEKMVGAPHVYVWETGRDISMARDMKESGVDKALFLWDANHQPYPVVGYDTKLKELGYATGGYELFSDLHKRDTTYYDFDWNGSDRFRHAVYPGLFNRLAARKKDGTTYSNRFGTYACPAAMAEQVERKVSRKLKDYPHECYFVDVYQANGLYECYSKKHSVTREGYANALNRNLKYLEDQGLYVGGEWGADFAVPHSVYVHGMMTLQRTWFDSEIEKKGTIYYYGSWKNNSCPSIMVGTRTATPTYLKYSINEATRVPLYELVYHDAVVTSWRWEDGNQHYPEIWWKKDLFNMLYGSAPLWNLNRNRWDEFKETFRESYENVCPWLQKIAYDELVSHSFVTSDGKIQRSEFSSGQSIVVNFSDSDYDYEGQTVKSRSYLINAQSDKQVFAILHSETMSDILNVPVSRVNLDKKVHSYEYMSRIPSLEGEVWYGAYTAKAYCNTPFNEIQFQPYPSEFALKDLARDNNGNQAAPLLVSNRGRYVWSDEPFAFELKQGDLLLYSSHEEITSVQVGGSLRDAYMAAMRKHFPPTGRTPDMLMFKMPQYNTWIELGRNQNQKDILKYAADIIDNGFPTGVFMVDDQWAKDYGCFEFDPVKFPDPKAMVDELHGKGFKIMLWLTPFISPDGEEFKEMLSKGGLVLEKGSRSPAIIKWWNGYSACLDLTKEVAMNWLRGKLKNLQDNYGIDGFKFDAVDFDFYVEGSTVFPNKESNAKGYEQSEIYTRLGTEFAFSEMRASWKNGNQPVAQRLQDKGYSWNELKLLIPDMISAGLIGHPYTCPDMIGGGLLSTFEDIDYDTFDQTLMIRSAQNQALMPMMQFSVAPWRVLDRQHLDMCRAAALLHSRMGDYIYGLAQEAARNGEPIVRHMEYVFPHEGFLSCNDQYMLGDKYLVAPMIEKGTTRTVALPKGKWKDEQGKVYKGGRTVRIEVPLGRLPYFECIN